MAVAMAVKFTTSVTRSVKINVTVTVTSGNLASISNVRIPVLTTACRTDELCFPTSYQALYAVFNI